MQKKNNNTVQGILILFTGLIIISCSLYIYFVIDKSYPNSTSSRVQDLNWLLNTFGKTGTAILFAIPGLIAIYAAIKKLRGKR